MSDLPSSLHASHSIPNRLITAEIFYHMPDYPDLLQSFLWQHLDRAPDFPKLCKFLLFWQQSLEGRLHSVRLAATDTALTSHWRQITATDRLH